MDIHERIGVVCAVGLLIFVVTSIVEMVTTWPGL